MNNILVCLISCQKNKELWNEYLEKDIDNLIIVCGDNDLQQLYKLDNKVLYLKCSDLYCGLCEKIIFMINAIIELEIFQNITHILKVDDDNYFTKENIIELSKSNVIKEYQYVGKLLHISDIDVTGDWHFNNTKPDNYLYNKKYYGKPNIEYLDGGEAYILSRYALNKIKQYYGFNDLDKIRREHIYEDYMIGEIMDYYRIKPYINKYPIYGDKGHTSLCELILWCDKFYSPPQYDKSIILICLFKNEYPLLDYFISYYKSVGVTHFIFINDISTDYSFRYLRHLQFKDPSCNYLLLNTPNSHLNQKQCYQKYLYNRNGQNWINFVLNQYCKGIWTLLVNTDEILDLSNYHNNINNLINDMKQTNSNALQIPLIDMYPKNIQDIYQIGEPFINHSPTKYNSKKKKITLFMSPKYDIDIHKWVIDNTKFIFYKNVSNINLLHYKYINIGYLVSKLKQDNIDTIKLSDLHIKYRSINTKLIDF